ncbi:hypothetical protein [Mesorhizobium sp. B2-6-2]|uniref:hypothetical protein n=1 Tax=Mesorhizobium sp. B2-6-2 TaxID=2589915 RepID=UPI00112A27BA|nr:hypothetical protein [Mesorhizobium sp. B2-6-2]TPJ77031.1 hypothetical protein FJ419_15995 [Mesorhizobium sp. B2-6-2]
MIEFAGKSYEATIGSDLQRDGMYLELADQDQRVVGEIFFSDVDGKMTVTLFQPEVPLEMIEWMIATARVRLPPADTTPG